MDEKNLYYIIGFLAISFGGSIVTGLVAAGKLIWYLSQQHHKTEQNTKDVSKAHEKIRKLDRDFQELFRESDA